LEWEIPRKAPAAWPKAAADALTVFWQARIKRQKAIDASIQQKAEFEYLYDKPFEDKRKIRMAGPFTVESISPHRVLGVDEKGDVIDPAKRPAAGWSEVREGEPPYGFTEIILENLKTAGVQSVRKEDRITFSSLVPWPGSLVCAALKTSLKAEINEDVWATLRSDRSRPFDKPASGRIAVKVINHLGDEVMKVFRV
jgi:adenine-specific DNA-methyltransferase